MLHGVETNYNFVYLNLILRQVNNTMDNIHKLIFLDSKNIFVSTPRNIFGKFNVRIMYRSNMPKNRVDNKDFNDRLDALDYGLKKGMEMYNNIVKPYE